MKAIAEIENLNDLQKKILGYCFEPRKISDMTRKFDRNQGYIWSLCQRLAGRKLLTVTKGTRNRVYYQTNKKNVKM